MQKAEICAPEIFVGNAESESGSANPILTIRNVTSESGQDINIKQ
jgi:hypothetical protein